MGSRTWLKVTCVCMKVFKRSLENNSKIRLMMQMYRCILDEFIGVYTSWLFKIIKLHLFY